MSEASDFDFLPGEWTIQNRRLRKRLAGSDEWEEFEATSVARHILGGLRKRGRVPHRPRRRLRRHVVPILRSGEPAVVDLLG